MYQHTWQILAASRLSSGGYSYLISDESTIKRAKVDLEQNPEVRLSRI